MGCYVYIRRKDGLNGPSKIKKLAICKRLTEFSNALQLKERTKLTFHKANTLHKS